MGALDADHLLPLLERVHARLRPDRALRPTPRIQFYRYVDTKSTIRERERRLHIRISDHLRDAPDPVLEGLMAILLCRLYDIPENRAEAHAIAAYHTHVRNRRVEERRHQSRANRGRKHIDPIGTHHSLLESFLRVTMDLDLQLPQAPQLSWSKTRSRRRLGHWDGAHNTIVISRILDDPRVPTHVLDYVVYHEILHILHPVEQGSGNKRRIHTPAFKAAERRYPGWQDAEKGLTKAARLPTPRHAVPRS